VKTKIIQDAYNILRNFIFLTANSITNILKSMSNGQKILFSFLAGAAAGVVAGLLLAPESGKETRKKLAKKATDLKSTLESKIKSFKTEETASN
jgi:hypothetical protein